METVEHYEVGNRWRTEFRTR